MYQAGFNLPSIGFKSIKQPWDNKADDRLERIRKLGPYSIGFDIVIICTSEKFCLETCPVAIPFDVVR